MKSLGESHEGWNIKGMKIVYEADFSSGGEAFLIHKRSVGKARSMFKGALIHGDVEEW